MSRIQKDDISHFMDYDIYLPTRTIYMGSQAYVDDGETGTDWLMAEKIIKSLHILDKKAPKGDSPINIVMNNLGGDVFHGMAIYDAIRNCKNHVTIEVYGYAMSMGAIILQAADERKMSENSGLMVHYGQFSMSDNARTVYNWVAQNKKMDKWMEDLFLAKINVAKPNYTRRTLKDRCTNDMIFDAKTALEFNLIDKIIGRND